MASRVTAKAEQSTIAVSHAAGPFPVEIHRGISVKHPHPRHWHEEFHACAITGGGGYTEYRGTAHLTPPGSLFLLPPGEVHSNRATDQGCSYVNIYLPAELVLRSVAQATGLDSLPPLPLVIFDSDIHQRFLQMCHDLESPDTRLHQETSVLVFFECLIHRFREQAAAESREPRSVRMVREFLDAHYDREIGLDELSQLTDLSPYHLNRTFRRELGIPPHAYQIQLRIARAKRLLRKRCPIAEVAHTTGFADQSHFTRHFKRMVGVTPGQFAQGSNNVQDRPIAIT